MFKKLKEMLFEKIIKATQSELLYKILPTELEKRGMNDLEKTDGYIFAHGNIPVMLVAHLDTVHNKVEVIEKNNGVWSSPTGIGGDDRCGIYMILELLEKLNVKPYVLFTTDEEIGGIGAKKFLNDYVYNEFDIKFMIEFDRKGFNDAVFYECQNKKFIDFIVEKMDMKFDYGSFTDICFIMEQWDVAGVNFSCGYYNAHRKDEYIIINDMLNVIEKTYNLIESIDFNSLEKFDAQCSYDYGFFDDDILYYEIQDDTYCEECLSPMSNDTYMFNCGICDDCLKKYFE